MKTTIKTIVTLICGVLGGCYLANSFGSVILALLDSVSVTFGRVGINIMTNTHFEMIGWVWLANKMLPIIGLMLVCFLSMLLIDVVSEMIHE